MHLAFNAWFWDRLETGSGQYSRRLAEHLVELEPALEVTLVVPHGTEYANHRFDPSLHLPVGESKLHTERGHLRKTYFEQRVFPRACWELGVGVAHVPYWGSPLSPSVPTVVTIHDLIPMLLREYRGGVLARGYTALVATTARSADIVLTDSDASRMDILDHLGLSPERVKTVPLAVGGSFGPEPGDGDESARERYDLPPCYVLYLGSFHVRKNLATALRAYTWVGRTLGEECPLVIAGWLPDRETKRIRDPRRQAQELGLRPEWVRFTGLIAEEDKPAVYRGAAAFIFPSYYEGFGLPPLEALACGTPVVGGNTSSIPEVVGDAGVLLDPHDAEGMAGAIIQLVQDPAFRAELSRRAVAQAARFSWERTARETLAAYREVLG
jgi:glycosyltransferase involved in cell wall biosynthesis